MFSNTTVRDTTTMSRRVLLVLAVIVAACSLSRTTKASPLTEQIVHYEPLRYDADGVQQQHGRARRNAESAKEVRFSFKAFGREFDLNMWPSRDVFSPGAVFEHIKDEGSRAIPYDMDTFYKGQVRGDAMSTLSGHVINGVFDGVIRTGDEVYYVELAKKFKREMADYHSVIYRHSDVHYNATGPPCGLKSEIYEQMKMVQAAAKPVRTEVPRPNSQGTLTDLLSSRKTRATGGTVNGGKYCQMLVATDDLFFRNIGGGDSVATVNEIASIFADVQTVYANTDFVGISGILPTIAKVQIISATDPLYAGLNNTGLSVTDFLTLWSTYSHDAYCLAMLLTYRTFSGGVLGLAWPAAPPGGNPGGICQRAVDVSSKVLNLNSAIVSFQNYGARVTRPVSVLTIAHEIGHGFGSLHDTTANCINQPGGSYIMYYQAIDGSQTNNNVFSLCSKASISGVLTTKSSCFQSSGTYCGNGIKEAGEQCDCGTMQECSSPSSSYDLCCNTSQTCRFKTGASCSGQDLCCSASTCSVLNQTTCFNGTACASHSTCDGVRSTCPTPTAVPDGRLCNNNMSTCRAGLCSGSQCAVKGLPDCLCTESNYLCHLCCLYSGTCQSTFTLANNKNFVNGMPFIGEYLNTGKPCDSYKGYCSGDNPPICKTVNNENVLKSLLSIFNTSLGTRHIGVSWILLVTLGAAVLHSTL